MFVSVMWPDVSCGGKTKDHIMKWICRNREKSVMRQLIADLASANYAINQKIKTRLLDDRVNALIIISSKGKEE